MDFKIGSNSAASSRLVGRAATLVAATLAAHVAQAADTYTARVVGVTDGDTATVLTTEQKQVKIRLAEIDAPEKNQAYGAKARQALSDLVFGKDVQVEVKAVDHYGRTVARLYLDELDVGAWMISAGMAWMYRAYSDDANLLELEATAKAERKGLWANESPIAPWEFRRGGNETTAASMSEACGSKQTCGEMADCAEATHYLRQCGVSQLDGDGDDIPCESLCR